MTRSRKLLGSWGESLALNYLIRHGDQLLERNFRTRHGELDLITLRQGRIVFTEVKTRSSDRFGLPEESITPDKIEHLLNSALAYLEANPDFDGDWQIDVIAIRRSPGIIPQITLFENAVSG